MSISQCLPHLTLDDPWWPWSELQILGTNNWPHPPSFMSIDQCLPHLTLDDPWWPCSDIQNLRHQQLTPPTKFHVHTSMFTPFYLIWPRMTPYDLEVTFKIFDINNWPHPPSFMSIYQCLPHLTYFDLGWSLMTLNWPLTFSASIIDPVHQVSCQPTNVYPFDLIWPWMTPDDLSETFTIFGTTIDPTH